MGSNLQAVLLRGLIIIGRSCGYILNIFGCGGILLAGRLLRAGKIMKESLIFIRDGLQILRIFCGFSQQRRISAAGLGLPMAAPENGMKREILKKIKHLDIKN